MLRRLARLLRPRVAPEARIQVERLAEEEWRRAQEGRFIGGPNERPAEYAFALRQLEQAGARTVLDVGTGRTAWPHLLASCGLSPTAIDNVTDYWPEGVWNRHWPVRDDDIRKPRTKGPFDAVTCLSVLEHIPEHEAAVTGMLGLLKPGGILILSVPFNARTYCENVYDHPDAGYGKQSAYITQVYSDEQLRKWVDGNGAELVAEELYEAFTGELWTMGERVLPLRKVAREERHHLGCFALRRG